MSAVFGKRISVTMDRSPRFKIYLTYSDRPNISTFADAKTQWWQLKPQRYRWEHPILGHHEFAISSGAVVLNRA